MRSKGAEKKYSERCKIEGCERAAKSLGMCPAHYERSKLGYTEEEIKKPVGKQGASLRDLEEDDDDEHWWARGTIFIPDDMKTKADARVIRENMNRMSNHGAKVDGGYEEIDMQSGKTVKR